MTAENVPMQDPQEPSLVTEEVVKPKRVRRTKTAEPVEGTAAVASDAAEVVSIAKPKRAPRKKAVEGDADESGVAAAPVSTPDVAELAETAAPAATTKRAPRKKVTQALEAAADASVPVEAPAVSHEIPQEQQGSDSTGVVVAASDVAEVGESVQRGERGRRDRGDRRGPRADRPAREERRPRAVDGDLPESAVDASEEEGEARPGARRVAMAAEQATEVFAELLSGEFDKEREEAEEAATEEGGAYKRVLLPEPDAPKLQKVLAQAGVGSRRDIEQMIEDGRIEVNDQVAHIGQRISFGDRIKVAGRPIKVRIAPPAARILAYHKPTGEVVTHDDPQGRPTVFRRLPRLHNGKWMSVGRLDLNTEGLLLFTNSGELANQLMHPRFGVEREYAVRVLGSLDESARARLLSGVEIDGQTASFVSISNGGGEGVNQWYRVVITEGRNREVRKLFDAVGLTVNRLIRVRYGAIVLPRGLKRGVWVELGESDVRAVKALAGMDRQQEQGQGGRGGRGQQKPAKPRPVQAGGQPQQGRGPQQGQGGRPQGKPFGGEPGAFGNKQRQDRDRDRQTGPRHDSEDDEHFARIPNPLEQTFDRRFVKGSKRITAGFGRPDQNQDQGGQDRQKGPRQPDPLQTSVGYIGADAFFGKPGGGGGGRRGGGGGGGRGRR
jgi:23S rRNA pseudouridine2605 synthase